MRFLITCSVLCFALRKQRKTQSLSLNILWAHRGFSASQWGKSAVVEIIHKALEEMQQEHLTWSLRVGEDFLEEGGLTY